MLLLRLRQHSIEPRDSRDGVWLCGTVSMHLCPWKMRTLVQRYLGSLGVVGLKSHELCAGITVRRVRTLL
jgi:hypothetical protein